MTRSVEYYLSLITSEHANKPNFVATVAASVSPFVYLQELFASFIPLFALPQAAGNQLDILGQWIGITRIVAIPLTGIYFTFDDPPDSGTGFDAGYFKELGDPSTGIEILPDELYRQLLYSKIAANKWTGGIAGAYAIFDAFTDVPGSIIITDNQNMTTTVTINSSLLTPAQVQLIDNGALPFNPAGIGVTYVVI